MPMSFENRTPQELAIIAKQAYHKIQEANDLVGECLQICPDMRFENDDSYDKNMECIGNAMKGLSEAVKWIRIMINGNWK